MASIDKRLAPDGLLFIGHADRLDVLGDEPKFVAVGHPGCFAYCHIARGDACLNSFSLKPPLAAEIIKSGVTAAGPAPVRLPPSDPTAMPAFSTRRDSDRLSPYQRASVARPSRRIGQQGAV